MAGTISGQQVQIDKVQIGTSPRFIATTADTTVRAGVGILRTVQVDVAGAAGSFVDLWDGAVGGGNSVLLAHIPGDVAGAGGLHPIDQTFAQGLHIAITSAGAAPDVRVLTGGI